MEMKRMESVENVQEKLCTASIQNKWKWRIFSFSGFDIRELSCGRDQTMNSRRRNEMNSQ
jgi:hypothetical protein